MQLSLDIIDVFRDIARQLSKALYELPFELDHNFRPWGALPRYIIEGDNLICYLGGNNETKESIEGAKIIFSDIGAKKILSLDVSAPAMLNEKITSQEVKKWTNAGSTEIKRQY